MTPPGGVGPCDPADGCPIPRVVVDRFDVNPGATIVLDGTPSSADAVSFRWLVYDRPDGSTAQPLEAFFDPARPGLGGFADDAGTASAVFHVDRPGRYIIKLIVADADGNIAPTAACPAHAYVVVEAARQPPVRAAGDACGRSGAADRCDPGAGLVCRMTAVDGAGVCGAIWSLAAETEPNHGSADAVPLPVGPDDAIGAALDPCTGEAFDVFVVSLAAPMKLAVETTAPDGTCTADTRLFHVDPTALDAGGYAGALATYFAFNDNLGVGSCARLFVDLPAGDHYFLVDEAGRDYALTYVVRAVPVRGAGERCDAHGRENYCDRGLRCDDPDGDGDGVCF